MLMGRYVHNKTQYIIAEGYYLFDTYMSILHKIFNCFVCLFYIISNCECSLWIIK